MLIIAHNIVHIQYSYLPLIPKVELKTNDEDRTGTYVSEYILLTK